LKETIVKQQIKISKLERRGFHSPSSLPTTITLNEHANVGGLNAEELTERTMVREMEVAEREARDQFDKAARERATNKVERWAASIAKREAREREKAEVRALYPLSPLFTPTID
jgi:hypothetical protein